MRGIKKFKNIHKGERCVIIGTGPSLVDTNFDLIKDEILFGCNSLFRGYKDFGISCRYYGVSDGLTMSRPHVRGLLSLDTTLFLTVTAYDYCFNNPNMCVWRSDKVISNSRDRRDLEEVSKIKPPKNLVKIGVAIKKPPYFSKDLSDGGGMGGTVVFDISLQVAYYMGFSEVYLIGCDSDYSLPFHFDGSPPDRFINNKIFDLTLPFLAYTQAKEAFEERGDKVINCTVGGKLEIFERKSLEEVFGGTDEFRQNT